MATESQIHANRQNAQHSTGPVTAEGKSTSSQNSLTLGLYTRQDYVKPEERDIYKQFCETMYQDLAPANVIEQSLAAEITGASWRLRRCSAVEAELADFQTQDPMLDDKNEKTIKSIERARASAHSLLHRSINQLRRLQTERHTREVIQANTADAGLADFKQITDAFTAYERGKQLFARNRELQEQAAKASFCEPPQAAPKSTAPAESASFCNPAPQIARNAQCPCGSREKYKRCCGRNAPPVLGRAA